MFRVSGLMGLIIGLRVELRRFRVWSLGWAFGVFRQLLRATVRQGGPEPSQEPKILRSNRIPQTLFKGIRGIFEGTLNLIPL